MQRAPHRYRAGGRERIDIAIMERAINLSVVPYDAEWSDLGGWDAVWSHIQPNAQGSHYRMPRRRWIAAIRGCDPKVKG